MKTARLHIREPLSSDLEGIKGYARNRDVMRHLMLFLESDGQIEDFLRHAIRQAQAAPGQRKEYILTVEALVSRNFIGTAIVILDHDSPHSAEIGYVLAPSEWGRGYATETARALVAFCFRTLKLHRVFGKCDALNTSSARVLEKCGMTCEGMLREHIWLRDHWRSSRLYGILDREFDGRLECGDGVVVRDEALPRAIPNEPPDAGRPDSTRLRRRLS